jgi:hypothetical protein
MTPAEIIYFFNILIFTIIFVSTPFFQRRRLSFSYFSTYMLIFIHIVFLFRIHAHIDDILFLSPSFLRSFPYHCHVIVTLDIDEDILTEDSDINNRCHCCYFPDIIAALCQAYAIEAFFPLTKTVIFAIYACHHCRELSENIAAILLNIAAT